MLYIHQTSCISSQQTFENTDLEEVHEAVNNKLLAIEPVYENIPPSMLRRMGKAVRISIGAAIPLLRGLVAPDGIIIGSGNGGMEDCIKFLNQIIDFDEGMLTPGHFVQSTANAMASQISLLTRNNSYNMTHVHLGLAFENALLDALMQNMENPSATFLVGGVDEISSSNYNIEFQDGWYKKEPLSNKDLYTSQSAGSLAGEGTAMFLVSGSPRNALARFKSVFLLHTNDQQAVSTQLRKFISDKLGEDEVDLLLSGENGDDRLTPVYAACESIFGPHTTIARYKHMTGEFPTGTAIASWLGCQFLQGHPIPGHMIKRKGRSEQLENMLIYNNYKGKQHSFVLLSKV